MGVLVYMWEGPLLGVCVWWDVVIGTHESFASLVYGVAQINIEMLFASKSIANQFLCLEILIRVPSPGLPPKAAPLELLLLGTP